MNHKIIVVFGAFDIVHFGHIQFLKKAKKLGNTLVAVLARDKNIIKIKGKMPFHNEKERKAVLKNIKLIDRVEMGGLKDPYKIIKKIKPQIIALGYDQNNIITKKLAGKIASYGLDTKIVRIRPYRPIRLKTSMIKKYWKIC